MTDNDGAYLRAVTLDLAHRRERVVELLDLAITSGAPVPWWPLLGAVLDYVRVGRTLQDVRRAYREATGREPDRRADRQDRRTSGSR